MSTAQLDLFNTTESSPIEYEEYDSLCVGDYATIKSIGVWGYYLWETCYIHEILEDGYLIEICHGLVQEKEWHKDGEKFNVPFYAIEELDGYWIDLFADGNKPTLHELRINLALVLSKSTSV